MNPILKELKRIADSKNREVLMRFFKTKKGEYAEGDIFLGVKVPQTRTIVNLYWKDCTSSQIKELVTSRYHEARLAGLLVLCKQYHAKKHVLSEQNEIVTQYLGYAKFINNWDLVDLTCYTLLGDWYFDKDRSPLIEMAKNGETLWKQRIAIVSTLQFIRRGSFETTFTIADILIDHSHDLIHKAVGWMLREVGKRDRVALENYLSTRYRRMPRTMLRYAIEKFPEPKRQAYLLGKI